MFQGPRDLPTAEIATSRVLATAVQVASEESNLEVNGPLTLPFFVVTALGKANNKAACRWLFRASALAPRFLWSQILSRRYAKPLRWDYKAISCVCVHACVRVCVRSQKETLSPDLQELV